ncbi:MAG TPA: T9SS type A sorting domain-containing protein [Bacteroidia bacterium]|nr:T9SS type A sorting domain-containing protein [Bacteroidia bacterium]
MAQVGENDSTFNTPDNVASSVYKSSNNAILASAAQANNSKFVLGGYFTAYNGANHNRIVRILANGSIDPSFNEGTGLNVEPSSIAIQADNKIIVGGNFTSYNGTATNGFIRLNEDGSVDNLFPAASVLSNANKIKIQSDGKFFALTNLGLVRINADGTIDASFANTAHYGGRDYAVQPDGKVIIASTGTDTVHLIRLLANGALDPSYTADIKIRDNIWSFKVNSIGLQLDGKVVIGGSYRTGQSQEIAILKRVNTDGTLDTTFVLDERPIWGIGAIYSVHIQPGDGKIIVAGHHDRAPGGTEHTYVQFIERLNLDGSTDHSFLHNNKYITNAYVIYTSTLLSSGKVLAGGLFEQVNGYSAKNVALLNSDGTLDSHFNETAGINGTVSVSAIQADQKILIGGLFSNVQYESRSHIARLLPDGIIDLTFNPGKGVNGSVYAIASQSNGKAIIGGEFTSFNTDTVKNIVRVNEDGSIDPSFQASISGIVYSLELQNDNKVLVGGYFSAVNNEAYFSFVRLNTDGSIDNTFERVFPLSETNKNTIYTSLILPNGQILAGGNFDVANKYSIIRLNADGTIDTAFTHNYSTVRDLARQPDGKIIAVGGRPDFPNSIGFAYVTRLNADGSNDTTWTNTAMPENGPVHSVTLLSTGQVLVGGEFAWSWMENEPPNYISLFDSIGHVDTTFVGFTDGPVYTTQGVVNDKVIIGGAFGEYAGVVRNNIARIYAPNEVPTGIKNHTLAPAFVLYPNPASSFINATDLKQGSTITIRNITGAVIYSEQVNDNRSTINISNFANGIYFMTQQNKAEISTQRFIVNR